MKRTASPVPRKDDEGVPLARVHPEIVLDGDSGPCERHVPVPCLTLTKERIVAEVRCAICAEKV